MKRTIAALFALVITGIVVLADDPGGMPIEYQFVSPLPVGAMRYFPNEGPQAEIDLMCDGSFEDVLPCWNLHPEGLDQIFYAGDDAFDGVNVMIQGIEHNTSYQAMQCWGPGVFDGYMNFTLWLSYQVITDEPGFWAPCSASRGLFIWWDPAKELWFRLTPDLWFFDRYDETNGWVTLETHLPGMETMDDDLVCLLIESQTCVWNSHYWFDDFVLAVDHVQNQVFVPIVSKNRQ